jgi:hypothetical protein
MNSWEVVSWDILWLLSHENVYDVHDDLADYLDFLFFEKGLVGLHKVHLIRELFQVLDHC